MALFLQTRGNGFREGVPGYKGGKGVRFFLADNFRSSPSGSFCSEERYGSRPIHHGCLLNGHLFSVVFRLDSVAQKECRPPGLRFRNVAVARKSDGPQSTRGVPGIGGLTQQRLKFMNLNLALVAHIHHKATQLTDGQTRAQGGGGTIFAITTLVSKYYRLVISEWPVHASCSELSTLLTRFDL